jgi:hypothetical protein
MMKKFFLGLVAFTAFIAGVFSAPAVAQVPLILEWKTNMKFGTFASDGAGGGTVVIPPTSNTRTLTGLLTDFGGTVKRGKFKLTGEPKTWVVLTMPSTIVIQKGTTAHNMTISNLTLSTTNPVKLSAKGLKNVFFGGTLTVGTDQKKGTYKNESFIVNAEYQ